MLPEPSKQAESESERLQLAAEIDRCRREIAAIEAEIRAGNPDLQGLCLGLSDWSWELRRLLELQKNAR